MSLHGWIEKAHEIDGRRFSAARYDAIARHAAAFPIDQLSYEADREALSIAALMLRGHHWNTAFRRPLRGHRANHWTTPALMWCTTSSTGWARLPTMVLRHDRPDHHRGLPGGPRRAAGR